MTISAKTTFTAPKRKTTLVAVTEAGVEIRARQNAKEVRIEFPTHASYIEYEHIEATIELLFAVKADREAQATFERKWLAEQADLQPHEEIISVEEPTA